MRSRFRGQVGQTTAEYLGVLVLVAAIVAALVLAQPGRLIGSGVRAKVCDIARHPCGGVSSSPHHGGGGVGGFLGGVAHGIGTGLGATGRALGGVGVGIYEGVKEPLVLGWKLSPQRAQLDPVGFWRDASTFATGLGHGVTHPKELGKAALDWDTWANDPARAVGHLIPNIVVVLATGGAGEAAETGEMALSAEARAAAENELRAAVESEARTEAEEATSTELAKYEPYPPDATSPRGFLGSPIAETLSPGRVLSRYGAEGGTYVSPQGTPFAARGLPPAIEASGENLYIVAKPLDVDAGIAAYWQGGGGGVQYQLPKSIEKLIAEGYLKRWRP